MKCLSTLFLCIVFQTSFAQNFIKPDHKKIRYEGRINLNSDSASLYWPGTAVNLNFKGTGISAVLNSLNETAFFYVIIDDSIKKKIEVLANDKRQQIELASNLENKKHRLKIYKLTNSTSSNQFYGFELAPKNKLLKPSKSLKRKIEFYGNSITAGHGVDVPEGGKDSGDPSFFNNYYTYAAITARHFNAHYSCIARSGIGLMVSWFDEIMPETYDRIDPFNENNKWDFSESQPDVIVVNLFQNDSWIVNRPEHPQFIRRFGKEKPSEEAIIDAYKNFINNIREKNPKANIICALGNMDATQEGSKWPDYIKLAIGRIDDPKIFQVTFPFKKTGGHPKSQEQQKMADQLINFIEENIKW